MAEVPQQRRFVEFGLGGEAFALEVSVVTDIIFPPSVTPVPGAPSTVLGLFNLRGVVTGLLEISSLFELTRRKRGAANRVLVLEPEPESAFALLVDYVSDITELDPAELLPPPTELPRPKLLVGIYNRGGGPVSVLDAVELTRLEAFAPYR